MLSRRECEMSDLEDERLLVERARLDPEAFGQLYDIHYERIMVYFFKRTMDISIAEDLTSNTFLKALKAMPKYNHKAPFSAWLYQIATNEVRMYWRRAGKHSRNEDARRWEKAYGKLEFSDSQIIDREEFLERMNRFDGVRRAVESLPERFRAPLALRFFEDLSYEEIGNVLRKPIGTVKVHVHRGLKRLKKVLGDSTETTQT